MMRRRFEATVSALCYELSFAQAEGAPPLLGPPYNDIVRFVLVQHGNMPGFLGSAIQAATIFFDLFAIPFSGSSFHALPPDRRRLRVTAWAASPLGPFRDIIKFYNSLVILALYSRRPAPVE